MNLPLSDAIKRLSRLGNESVGVLSVYLDTRGSDRGRLEAARVFVKDSLHALRKRPGPLVPSDGDLRRVEEYVEGFLKGVYEERQPGVAIFACEAGSLFETFSSRVPFENRFEVGRRPRLRRLVRLLDEYEPMILCLVDSHAARLLLYRAGEVAQRAAVEHPVPGRHHAGGWSQMNYQRHVDDQVDHHLKEVAGELTRWADRERARILLSGQDRVVASFRRHLPARTDERVSSTLTLPITIPEAEGTAAALREGERIEREEEDRALHSLLDAAASRGNAVLGLGATLAAYREGRIHRLFIAASKESLPGWACSRCDHVDERPSGHCPACGGPFEAEDLAEVLVTGVFRRDGFVESVNDGGRLLPHEGIGALLRRERP